MGTYTVTDCRSKFYDDGGPSPNPYLSVPAVIVTKTMSIFGGGPITMTFNPLGTQTQIQAGDFISFYDGPNAQSALIAGPFTAINGSNTLSNVYAPSGSLTVVWTENGNTVGHGWDGGWFSQAPPPLTPTASLSAIPSCSASVINFTTTEFILCDSLKANFYSISGPIFPVISTIVPMPCNNGTTTAFQIQLAQPLNKNCTYNINFTLFSKDKCDSVYKYPGQLVTFSINSCPFTASVNVVSTPTICSGDCATLTAIPESSCLTYTYQWSHGPTGAGPHVVCPTVTTTYTVTLTELTTFATSFTTQTIQVDDPQIAPLPSYTICTSQSSFNFTATPAGGIWIGPGITNTATGLFCPGCTSAGVKTVTYQVGNCIATIQFTTVLASSGSPDAACLNGPAFTVSGGSPAGGTWSGAGNISPTGVFTPTLVGDFLVTYSVGACASSKSIHVTNAITVPATTVDICKSQWWTRFYSGYGITPYGGRYSMVGPGITNIVLGTFSPSLAGVGLHVITYSLLSGCSETFAVNVLDIDVSPSTATTCPNHTPFLISTVPSTATPAGGTWSCSTAGSISGAGMYDPSIAGINSHTDILVYKATNGCPDTIVMKAFRTDIVKDSLFFCTSSSALQLSNNLVSFSYSPVGGTYSGPGVNLVGPNYVFNPTTAGQGIHTVFYDISGCNRDSIKMIVYPALVSGYDATVCSTHPTMMVVSPPLPFGTTWSGPGILTPSLGIFNPGAVIAGSTSTLTFSNRAGCGTGDVKIYVYQFVAADIGNLNTVYCYKNNNSVFTTVPPNGTLSAVSSMTNNNFNPSVVGAGDYTVVYSFGEGACFTTDTVRVKIHPQLTTTTSISAPTICLGESCKLNVQGSGGLPTVLQYTYTWSDGLIPISNQNVVPNATTLYTVITSDGCSDDVIDTLRVTVQPTYYPSFITPLKECYGVAGQVTVNITPVDTYSYTWNTTPVQTSNILSGVAGKNYFLKILNTSTGCTKDTSVIIPGYNAIQALFSPNPNLTCIPFENNLVSFLDLSNGALSGTWSFNGSTQSYTPGVTVQYEFDTPGTYNVTLDVVNDGNCPSSMTLPICILESTEIYLPDIFSPNKDGNNDVYYVRGNGVKEMKFLIYDRWGSKVFESNDVSLGWDGTFHGKDAEPGVYAYYLEVLMFTDKKITKKGDITLVR